jgi:hypothetical protein
MPRNYVVVPGRPFVRAKQIIIDYPAPATAHIRVTEELAILTDAGVVEPIRDIRDIRFTINPSDMSTALTLVHPSTTLPLGPTMTYEQLMLGLLAAVRKEQLARDEAEAPQPSAPEE